MQRFVFEIEELMIDDWGLKIEDYRLKITD
jgi:hypothetical protein